MSYTKDQLFEHYTFVNGSSYQHFTTLLNKATLAHFKEAEEWYDLAKEHAYLCMEINPAWTLEVACSVISAYSPLCSWKQNKNKSLVFASGKEPKGLAAHTLAAYRCTIEGFKGLKGLKTNAFARAISGDMDAVVVDSWMMKATGLGHDSPTVTEYRAISDTIVKIANELDMKPAHVQALVWILIRGKKD